MPIPGFDKTQRQGSPRWNIYSMWPQASSRGCKASKGWPSAKSMCQHLSLRTLALHLRGSGHTAGDATLKRGWVHIAGNAMTSFVCLPWVSAAAGIIFPDLVLPGDPRFTGMKSEFFLVKGHDKRQKTPRIVIVHDALARELLNILFESYSAHDWRLFRSSAAALRRKLKRLCKDLGWKELKFVSHFLRYGCAVHEKAVSGLSV